MQLRSCAVSLAETALAINWPLAFISHMPVARTIHNGGQ